MHSNTNAKLAIMQLQKVNVNIATLKVSGYWPTPSEG